MADGKTIEVHIATTGAQKAAEDIQSVSRSADVLSGKTTGAGLTIAGGGASNTSTYNWSITD